MKFNKNEFGWKEKVSINTDDNKFSKNYEDLNNEPFTFVPIKLTETNKSNGVITAYCDVFDLEQGHRYIADFTKYDYVCLYTFNNDNTKNTSVATTSYLSTGRNGMITIMSSSATNRNILWMSAYGSEQIRIIKNSDETFTITNSLIVPRVTNTKEFTPTSNYHLVHKKYVDDKFVMNENIETIYTIPMSEMQKCNNGTSMYVSSINFDELFINHEKYIYYANYKDDTLIPITYDNKYNRFVTDTLDKVGNFDIILAFDLGTHKMYPFSGGIAEIKAYTFTNDLIIKRVPILDVNDVATKKYVDDNDIKMLEYVYGGKVFKITLTDEQEERLWNLQSGEYIVLDSVLPEDIYKCTDTGSIWYGCILINNNILFKVGSFGSLKINTIKSDNAINFYTENTYYNSSTQAGIFRYNWSLAVLNNTEQVVLVKCNDLEYHYASENYVNNAISNILSFNESGELVVTINGVSKTFVPKPK